MTGDIALIDEDGFIQITGRQSRFSKIGGEMVPHMKIEEALAQVIGADEEEGFRAVVTAVPDEKKGERIVVLHTSITKTPEELRKGLSELGLPNLYIPSEDSFYQIETIPVLGTGKLDLRGVKQLANQVFGASEE
jgi:acyl-[acyl-carrier-protein]-phospholipid O-acyltransferase/long-chain-fatty-acid--[acyl-carrier-protein] ligase